MDDRFLFPEAHLLRPLTKKLQDEFPFDGTSSLSELFDTFEDYLTIVDQDTLIHYANNAAIQRFGGKREELIGKTLIEKMPFPQSKSRWQTILKAVERNGSFSFIDNANGKYAITHILPFKEKVKSKAYYLIYTLENDQPLSQSSSKFTTTTSVFEETLRAVHETPHEDYSNRRVEHHLRMSFALANAATGASAAEDLPTALNNLCAQACLALEAPAAVIRLYNPNDDTLEIVASYGLSEEHIQKNFAIPYAPLSYLASEIAPKVMVADLDRSPPTPADQLPYRAQLTASVIGNIVRQNRFLGVLVILVPKVHPPITREDLLFVQALAEQASISIDRFHLMEIQQRRTRELENIVRIGLELREAITKQNVVTTLLNALAKDIHLKFGASYLLENTLFGITSRCGEHYQLPESLNVPPDPCWEMGQPLFFKEFSPSIDLLGEGNCTLNSNDRILALAIPLRTSIEIAGIILLGFWRPIRLTIDDQQKIYLIQQIGDAAMHRADALEHLEELVLERTRELSILYEVSSLLNAPTDLKDTIEKVLENVLSIAKAEYAAIHLFDVEKKQLYHYLEKSSTGNNSPIILTNLKSHAPWQTVFEQNNLFYISSLSQCVGGVSNELQTTSLAYIGLPIRSKGSTLGVLSILNPAEQIYSLNDQVILTAIADQLGLAIERARLAERGEEIAKLEERQRLARELHDALTQSLYSMTLLTSGYKRSLHHATTDQIHDWLDELSEVAQNALAELRLLLYELRPTALEQDGLQGALKRRLEAVEKRAGIQTTLEIHGSYRLPSDDEEHFYRIAQEALNNALQHARHTSIHLAIESTPLRFDMLIADDGVGFDFDRVIEQNQHSGLNNMFSRARQIDASLSIETALGRGTTIRLSKEYNHV